MRVDSTYKNNPNFYEMLIIGAGPAGLTTALYAARANLKVAFIERDAPGGKVTRTAVVENYPGFETAAGADLALKMMKQATDCGATYLYGNVVKIVKVQDLFHIITDDNVTRYALTVVIASGMIEKKLGVPGEEEYYGRGVSYCAICDGAIYKNKPVAVLGGGNSALEEAVYLSTICSKVYLVHRREEFRAEPVIIKDVMSNNVIQKVLSQKVISFDGDGKKIVGITTEDAKGSKSKIAIDAIFTFIGFDPVTDFLKELNIVDQSGFVSVNENLETKIPGLFAAGDVIDKKVRQISTATGDGTIAALTAKKYIESLTSRE